MENEIWKDIPGYEGKYQASTLGRIKSLNRYITRPHPKTKEVTRYLVRERILKNVVGSHGYYVVGLGQHNNQKTHRLVALTFLGTCPVNQEVRHLNGVRTDNRIENLKYGTRSDNHIDRYEYGSRMGPLNSQDVIEIRSLLLNGKTPTSVIAEKFGVTCGAIAHIRQGRTFQWLT